MTLLEYAALDYVKIVPMIPLTLEEIVEKEMAAMNPPTVFQEKFDLLKAVE